MSDLVGFEVSKLDWIPGPDLLTRFKRFSQKCELLLDGPLKSRDHFLLWSGDYGLVGAKHRSAERPEGLLDKI